MKWEIWKADNAKVAIENASNYQNIRHIKIPKEINSIPNTDLSSGTWEVTNANSISDFTTVGYYFAKELYNKLQIPIGLINVYWGGSVIETWTIREGF